MIIHKRWIGGVLLVPLILIFIIVGTVLTQSSTHYKIKKSVIDQGGSFSQSTNYHLVDAVGQPSAIGLSSSNSYQLTAGFFAGVSAEPTEPGWKVPITVSGNSVSIPLAFGGDAGASDAFDSGMDVAAAPPGMSYYAYFKINVIPEFLQTDIRGWIPPYEQEIDWVLILFKGSGITSTLNWDASKLPPEGSFTLVGSGLNVNMREQSSAQLSGDASLTIQYRSGPPVEQVKYDFAKQGWYLISLPVMPDDNSLGAIFPGALAAFAYNTTTGNYYGVTALEPRIGYWLLIPSPTTVTIEGVALMSYSEHYTTGWHLIGSVIKPVDFSDPNDNPNGSVIAAYGWDFNTSQYHSVYPGDLEPKEGYWLAVIQACDLTIGSESVAKTIASVPADFGAFHKRFGSQPPVPPFLADRNVAELLPISQLTALNYPNPFNPETVIEYSLPNAGPTRICIYNALGQKIRTLLEEDKVPGIYRVLWDGRDEHGNLASNGIYFYRITNAGEVRPGKMLLMK